MQSLCLDVRVLDINQNEIDLKQNFDDDDPIPANNSFEDEETTDISDYSDDDIRDEGYLLDDEEGVEADAESVNPDDEFGYDDDELNINDDDDLEFNDFDIDGSFDDEV